MTNSEQARRCFALARDLDSLPFRADTRINRMIADTAKRYVTKHVYFLDAQQLLSASTADLITGEESFYDHVHLNFSGNYRMGRALAEQAQRCLPLEQAVGSRRDWADESTCAARLALTDWNRLTVLEEMKNRLSNPPFTNQLDHQSRLARLNRELNGIQIRLRSQPSQDARRVYEPAVKERPSDHWLHHNFAEYLTGIGELGQATSEMQQVCKLVPQHYSAYFHAGRLEARQKKYDEARLSLETALKLRPEFTDIYLELGRMCATSGDWQGGLHYCALAEERHFDDGRIHVLKAKIFESRHQREQAIQSLREAIQRQPGLWEAHDMLGAELALDGRFAEAQSEFEGVVRLQPDYAEGHLNLGIALARQGRFEEAVVKFQDTLRLDPQNRRAQEFLSTIAQLKTSKQ